MRAWDDPLFEIEVGGNTAYACNIEGACLAYWTLIKEWGVWGTKGKVRNLDTGKVVWNA